MDQLVRSDRRVLIAPHEICGQMGLLARGLRNARYHATSATFTDPPRGYLTDLDMGLPTGPSWRSRSRRLLSMCTFFAFAASNFDVFHFFFGTSLLPANADFPLLKAWKRKIIMHFRGSDIRNPDYLKYMASLTREKQAGLKPPISTARQRKKIRRARRYCDRILVSTPDLLGIIPEATVIPQAIDLKTWKRVESPVRKNRTICIVHAATNRFLSGTALIENAVKELEEGGLKQITLYVVENVPYSEVREIYSKADIAIGKLTLGWYGNFAIEMMALGKPVICNISAENRKYLSEDCPIVSANPAELEGKLRMLIENVHLRRRLGQQGPEYVRAHHSVPVVVRRLMEIYDALYDSN